MSSTNVIDITSVISDEEIRAVNEAIPNFLAIVGDGVTRAQAQEILLGAGGNLEVALNHYFSRPPSAPEPKVSSSSQAVHKAFGLTVEKDEEDDSSSPIPSLTPPKELSLSSDDSDNSMNEPKSPDSLQFERDVALALKLSLEQDGLELVSRKRKADEMDSSLGRGRNVKPRLSTTTVNTSTDYNKNWVRPEDWLRKAPDIIEWETFGVRLPASALMTVVQRHRSEGYRLAPQPPELKVELREYQRMSLAWMIDREMFGWRLPREPYGSESPLVHGGFLCEEMGLGKTCEILALILARRSHPGVPRKPTLIICTLTLISQWKIEIQKLVKENELKIGYWHGGNRRRDYLRSVGQKWRPSESFFDDVDVVLTSYTLLHDSALQSQRWLRVVLDESQMLRNPHSRQTRNCMSLTSTYKWCVTGTPVGTGLSDLFGSIAFLNAQPLASDAFWKMYFPKNSIQVLGANYLVELLRIGMMRHTKDQKINGKPIVYFPSKTTRTILIKLSEEEQRAYNALEADVLRQVRQLVWQSGRYINSRYTALVQLLSQLRDFCSLPTVSTPAQIQRQHGQGKQALGYFDKPPPSRLSQALINFEAILARASTVQTNFTLPSAVPAMAIEDREHEELVKSLRKRLIELDRYQDCDICMDAMDKPTCTRNCLHLFCNGCITDWVVNKEKYTCPTCRAVVKKEDLIEVPWVPPEPVVEEEKNADAMVPDYEDEFHRVLERSLKDIHQHIANEKETRPMFKPANPEERLKDGGPVEGASLRYPSKIKRLIDDITHLRRVNRDAKVVVFSQWRNTLDAIATRFREQGIIFAALDGSMSETERSAALEKFNTDPNCVAFLLSIRVGSVGISLTAANHIFLMDHCLNPATEKQAVNRCHRLGQDRPVTVVKYIAQDTMEHKLHLLRNDPNVLETVENDIDDLEEDNDDGSDEEEEKPERKVVHAIDVPVMLKLFNVTPVNY